jgi:hypothetical protein
VLGQPARQFGDRLAVASALEQLTDERPADRGPHEAAHGGTLDLFCREASAADANHPPAGRGRVLELRRELR